MSLGDAAQTSMYDRLETALDEKGEVMIRLASGEEGELHKHNVEFEDQPYLKVEGEDETRWINAEFVESYWIHDEY
jgi:transcriptional antiterminator Rof (Rho-off)